MTKNIYFKYPTHSVIRGESGEMSFTLPRLPEVVVNNGGEERRFDTTYGGGSAFVDLMGTRTHTDTHDTHDTHDIHNTQDAHT